MKQENKTTELVQKYNALSPMMKIIFSAKAQGEYIKNGTLEDLIADLQIADQLAIRLLRFPFSNTAQAQTLVRREIDPFKNKKNILNYADNALRIGDSIVFRLAYAHDQVYHSVTDFITTHPMMKDSQTLQREVAFLIRFDKTPFTMADPQYSSPYSEWVKKTQNGKSFQQRRSHYTNALKWTFEELGIERERITPQKYGIGRSYIREVCRTRA